MGEESFGICHPDFGPMSTIEAYELAMGRAEPVSAGPVSSGAESQEAAPRTPAYSQAEAMCIDPANRPLERVAAIVIHAPSPTVAPSDSGESDSSAAGGGAFATGCVLGGAYGAYAGAHGAGVGALPGAGIGCLVGGVTFVVFGGCASSSLSGSRLSSRILPQLVVEQVEDADIVYDVYQADTLTTKKEYCGEGQTSTFFCGASDCYPRAEIQAFDNDPIMLAMKQQAIAQYVRARQFPSLIPAVINDLQFFFDETRDQQNGLQAFEVCGSDAQKMRMVIGRRRGTI